MTKGCAAPSCPSLFGLEPLALDTVVDQSYWYHHRWMWHAFFIGSSRQKVPLWGKDFKDFFLKLVWVIACLDIFQLKLCILPNPAQVMAASRDWRYNPRWPDKHVDTRWCQFTDVVAVWFSLPSCTGREMGRLWPSKSWRRTPFCAAHGHRSGLKICAGPKCR